MMQMVNVRCGQINYNIILWLLFIYPVAYHYAGNGFINQYQDKKDLENKVDNYYYVPIRLWLRYWYFRLLLGKQEWLLKYPDTEAGVVFADYRELQKIIVCRAMYFPFLIADIVLLIIYRFQYAGLCIVVYVLLCAIIEIVLSYPVMRHDVKRLKSYQYVVANYDEAVLSDARRNPPRLWKINTLLDVFFYFGEACIRYCEPQNYLVYRLKNGNLIYVLLKDSFETMPVPEQQDTFTLFYYNHAMAVWVDEVIILDKNLQNYNQLLTMKNIKPQDMPDNFC